MTATDPFKFESCVVTPNPCPVLRIPRSNVRSWDEPPYGNPVRMYVLVPTLSSPPIHPYDSPDSPYGN
ncbi:hypothetical protein M8J75_010695 [Diaphorina citri]|nr:hypothetical protein M8J75_010695 [Diaphorina citri]